MNEDCLKLTTYFGERDRTADGLLSDELMNIYGGHRLQTSILLRGAEGFGRLQHLHTDRLLSLSEDLPVVSIAIDERERIESMLDAVLEIKRRGLITLERARLLSGEIGPVQLPEQLDEATKLTIYVGRQERVYRTPAYMAICDLLYRRGVDGASVLLGVDGTRRGRRFRAKFFGRNADVPMMIIAVGSGAKIANVLPELGGLLHDPLITLERVRICKRDGELLTAPQQLPGTDEAGLALWQKLMIYTSHVATHEGSPLHLALIRRLREADAAGATCLRGIWGFHGDHAPHGDKFFQIQRHVPVCTITIDTPQRTAESFKIIDEITSEHGLVTSEVVPAVTAMSESETHGGLRLADLGF
jgi:PII-like signaling protein